MKNTLSIFYTAFVAFQRLTLLIAISCLLPQVSFASETDLREEMSCENVAPLKDIDISTLTVEQLYVLAIAYDTGQCVEQNYNLAFKAYRAAAGHGSNFSKVRVGYFYLNGLGVERDTEIARFWFRSFAFALFTDENPLIYALLKANFLDDPIPNLLKQEIRHAIEDGNGSVDVWMQNYRDLYEGNGMYPDPTHAMSWLHKAVMAKHPAAYYEEAVRALENDKNSTVYVLNLKLAARANHPAAQVDLGKLYLTGDGVKKWPYMALVWFLRAQRNGLDVTDLIMKSGHQLDHPLDRKLAIKNAAKFDFNNK